MSHSIDIVEQKNAWLISHVDVSYPTEESIKGRELYLKREQQLSYQQYAVSLKETNHKLIDDIYLVDFHRLTVMFAQLQAAQWPDAESQAYILEFFAQITLDENQPMYIGFSKGTPTICAMVTKMDEQLLISDIATSSDNAEIKEHFANMLVSIVNSEKQFACYLSSLNNS